MRERAAGLARLAADVRDERGRLEAMAADEMLARRASINKGLRYHRVLFERDGGGWACRGFEEARDKVARAEATCGFSSSLAHGVPGGAIDHLRACRTRDEQERYFEQTRERMGLDTQGCPADSSKAGRLFCLFVGLILSSAVRATWRSSPDLRKEFPTPLDVLDEMHDIRWCGYPDGTSHMTPFLASQVRICEAFGIEVPRECLSASEGRKADSGRGRESSKLLGRGTRPAQNKIQAHPASA